MAVPPQTRKEHPYGFLSKPFTLFRGALERAADCGFLKVTANLVRGLVFRPPREFEILPFLF